MTSNEFSQDRSLSSAFSMTGPFQIPPEFGFGDFCLYFFWQGVQPPTFYPCRIGISTEGDEIGLEREKVSFETLELHRSLSFRVRLGVGSLLNHESESCVKNPFLNPVFVAAERG